MKLNNSIKLSMANFSLFWKILIYKVFAIGIIILMLLPIVNTINSCLVNVNFYTDLNNCFAGFQSINVLTANIFICCKSLLSALSLFASSSVIGFIYFLVLIFFLAPFVLKFSDVPASETTYSYMSSLNKNTFMVNFFDSFGKSAGYSALKTLLEIPFYVAFWAGLYGILSISIENLGLNILAPLLLFVYITFFISLKITILSGWVSSIVAFNINAGSAFKKGIKAVSRKFLSTLSSFAVITVVMVAILYIFGIYSLLVIIPLSSLITNVFGQVLFFESQGMNYYISPDNIVMPRKLEQADSIRKVKDII